MSKFTGSIRFRLYTRPFENFPFRLTAPPIFYGNLLIHSETHTKVVWFWSRNKNLFGTGGSDPRCYSGTRVYREIWICFYLIKILSGTHRYFYNHIYIHEYISVFEKFNTCLFQVRRRGRIIKSFPRHSSRVQNYCVARRSSCKSLLIRVPTTFFALVSFTTFFIY